MIPLLLALSTPACPSEYRLDTVVTQIEAQGGMLLGLVAIPGQHADQLLVATLNGAVVVVGLVYDGCVIGPPRPLDAVAAAKGTPA
jgi:hypothetical protein